MMDEEREILEELAALLLEHREEIIDAWSGLVTERFPASGATDYLLDVLRDRLGCILDDVLTPGFPSKPDGSWLRAAPVPSIEHGVNIERAVEARLTLKEAAVPFIVRAYTGDPVRLQAMLLALDRTLRLYLSYYATLFADEASQRLIQRQEQQAILEERQRLSREVHDNLAQALGLLKLKCTLVAESLGTQRLDQVESALNEMHEIAVEAYTDAREAILGLRSLGGEDLGSYLAFRRYLAHYSASFGMDIDLAWDEGARLALMPRVRNQVQRIAHEALSNVRKHAHAQTVWVRVEPVDDWLRIVIEDDGEGFDPAAVGPHGVGLQVMRERAESVDGELEIDSQPGRGTRVTVMVPRTRESEEGDGATAHFAGG